MSKLNGFLFLLFVLTIGIDSRALRKRRGIWPDVLAPGGNTYATRGYYNMQSYIAYPESGIAFNPYGQGWNPFWQGYYQQNQFNYNNPYGYNPPYQYPSGPGIAYGGPGINGGLPYSGQGNYIGYYPGGAGNLLYPPGNNFGGMMRSGVINSRISGDIGEPSPLERTISRSLSPPSNPTN